MNDYYATDFRYARTADPDLRGSAWIDNAKRLTARLAAKSVWRLARKRFPQEILDAAQAANADIACGGRDAELAETVSIPEIPKIPGAPMFREEDLDEEGRTAVHALVLTKMLAQDWSSGTSADRKNITETLFPDDTETVRKLIKEAAE